MHQLKITNKLQTKVSERVSNRNKKSKNIFIIEKRFYLVNEISIIIYIYIKTLFLLLWRMNGTKNTEKRRAACIYLIGVSLMD